VKKPRAAKLIVLPLIVIATWALTSRFGPKLRPAVAAQPDRAADFGDRSTKTVVTQAGLPEQVAAPPNRQLIKRNLLLSHSIEAAADGVHVAAKVLLINRVGGDVYLWRLSARRAGDGATVMDIPYEHQFFEIDPSGEMSPTFSDVVGLPAGKHKVVLTLYAVPKGTDLATLRDEAKAIPHSIIRFFEVVEIK
jgi:hypothetical protein